MNIVVDPGSFNWIEGRMLHLIPAGFLPHCSKTALWYLQKIFHSYKSKFLLSKIFLLGVVF